MARFEVASCEMDSCHPGSGYFSGTASFADGMEVYFRKVAWTGIAVHNRNSRSAVKSVGRLAALEEAIELAVPLYHKAQRAKRRAQRREVRRMRRAARREVRREAARWREIEEEERRAEMTQEERDEEDLILLRAAIGGGMRDLFDGVAA